MSIEFKCTSHVDEVLEEMEAARQRALNAIGLQLERNAKMEINKAVYDTPKAPTYKRTGRLRGSITYATKTKHDSGDSKAKQEDYELKGEPEEDRVYVGTNVEYAPYVEFGTSRGMPPRPYLRPALENHLDEYKTIAQTELST